MKNLPSVEELRLKIKQEVEKNVDQAHITHIETQAISTQSGYVDITVIVDFKGDVGARYTEYDRAIGRIGVDLFESGYVTQANQHLMIENIE